MRRKALSLIVTLAVCMSMFAGTDKSAKSDDGQIENIISPVDISQSPLKFKILSDSTVEVEKGNYKDLDSVNIPSKVRIDGKVYNVTSIGERAFKGCSSLTSISIPKSVSSIGSEAFKGCSSLTSISIPESVSSIKYRAFEGCSSLASISIPKSVSFIGDHAFEGCRSLTSISIPERVYYIGWGAFKDCSSLASISIPKSVPNIEDEAFSGCSSLTSISIPKSVSRIDFGAFKGCVNLDVVIENSEENVKVGTDAFEGCKSVKFTK